MKYILILVLFSFSTLQAAEFDDLLEQLSNHLDKQSELSAEELSTLEARIIENAPALAKDIHLVTQSFELVSKYDQDHEPLFLNDKTRGGFARVNKSGFELEHVIFQLQQAILESASPRARFQGLSLCQILPGRGRPTKRFPGGL